MALYNTRFGLPQSVADYLNQGLPSISGIFQPEYSIMPIEEDITNIQSPVGLTEEQLRLLYPQTGGGDDVYRGGGKFGNLDLSRSKTFTKDIYDEEEGDFVPTELIAYYNPTLGNYQTFEGKNINPAFSNRGLPTFGLGSLAMNILGMTPKTVGGYVPGSIRGFYDSPMDLIKRRKNEQLRTTQQIAESKKADEIRMQNLRKAQITGGGGGGGGYQPTSRSQNVARTESRVSGGKTRAYGL
jgi:hypothetical protein